MYKNNAKSAVKKYQYKTASNNEDENKYSKLIKNLEEMVLELIKYPKLLIQLVLS